mgnify:CR=1 FL=1
MIKETVPNCDRSGRCQIAPNSHLEIIFEDNVLFEFAIIECEENGKVGPTKSYCAKCYQWHWVFVIRY